MRIHDNEVNKISECNLMHDIINSPKRTKFLNIHYSNIIHGCMNTRKVSAVFKTFWILLDSGCRSMIVMTRLVKKLYPENDDLMLRHTQAVNITNNIKVKVYFSLPALRATNVVMWKCHVDNSAKGRYNIILEWYLWSELELNLKLSDHVIGADDGYVKESMEPMVDVYVCVCDPSTSQWGMN